MMKIFYFTILFFITTVYVYSQSNAWRGITPLHSTRADVERLFGKPDGETGVAKNYYVKYEKEGVVFTYTEKRCQEGWNVGEDTVLSIHLTQGGKSVRDLQLSETENFQTVAVGETGSLEQWTDAENGVKYIGREDVVKVYIPRKADNILRCNGFPPFVPEKYGIIETYQAPFYESKKSAKESLPILLARLDSLLISVRREADKESSGTLWFILIINYR